MIGKKLYKNNKDDMAQYTSTAQWCNANNAHIEDKGTYYEVCENVVPEPTTEEKLAQLDSEYEQAKADIFEAYQTAVLMGDTDLQTTIQADFAELNADYAEERAAIINE